MYVQYGTGWREKTKTRSSRDGGREGELALVGRNKTFIAMK